eukprot:Gb_17405 [translate_table: standard]
MVDKGKRSRADEEDGSDHIDGELVLSIEKLQEIQDELERVSSYLPFTRGEYAVHYKLSRVRENIGGAFYDIFSVLVEQVNEEASDRVLEVEQKYNEIRRPVYDKRNDIIQTIPDFWLTAFLSHPALCDLLTEEDQKVFKYLQSLDVDDFKDVKSGYSITFTFRPNPYFEDTKLVKVFSFSDEGTTKISGTTVKWKDGMNVTNGISPDKEGNKRPFQEESHSTSESTAFCLLPLLLILLPIISSHGSVKPSRRTLQMEYMMRYLHPYGCSP